MGMMVEDEIVFKKISEIKPYIRNSRKNAKTVELLCKLIPKVGFNVPLVIDEKGVIVKGHARYGAAIKLGMEELPCIITHADEEAVRADRILDNKISEFSEWMNDEVLQEIESIDTDIDFSELGFPTVNLDDVSQMPSEGSGSPVEGFNGDLGGVGGVDGKNGVKRQEMPKKYYKCVCPDCGHVMFVEASLIEGRK